MSEYFQAVIDALIIAALFGTIQQIGGKELSTVTHFQGQCKMTE